MASLLSKPSCPQYEILAPDHNNPSPETAVCLCCQRRRSIMDQDGCGICDECLGPGIFSTRADDAASCFPMATGIKTGVSQIFAVNELLTIGGEIAAPNVMERADDSECYC